MAFLYAMSDIHGELEVFEAALRQVDLRDTANKLLLLGDYIDYGAQSGQVLRSIHELQQSYGEEQIVVLKGNHEVMLLEWLETYSRPKARKSGEDDFFVWNDWLRTDKDTGFKTLRTFLSRDEWEKFAQVAPTLSEDEMNLEAAKMILAANKGLFRWLKGLPCYYETETQIFVHAGVDEEAGDWWAWGTPDSVFTGKYPAETGKFYKDIIAGHVGTASLAGDPDYYRVFWDGQSHYYIDGSTAKSGCLPILKYDTETGHYTELVEGNEERIENARKN